MKNKYATVEELMVILERLKEEGYGDAVVGCNSEYALSLPTYEKEKPEVGIGCTGEKYVNFGGYC